MGKAERDKGHGYEREICKELRPIFPLVKRKLEYQEGYGIDLDNTGSFDPQLKRRKKISIYKWFKEIPDKPNRIKLLIMRADNEESLVSLKLADFKKILADIGEAYTS